jgi:hypothetical protein
MDELKCAPDGLNSNGIEIMFSPVGGGAGGFDSSVMVIELRGRPSDVTPLTSAGTLIVALPSEESNVTGPMNSPSVVTSPLTSTVPVPVIVMVVVTGGVVVVVVVIEVVVVMGVVVVIGAAMVTITV